MASRVSFLDSLGVSNPVLAAPMAGGPSTVDLVRAAGDSGSLGFLAAGYRTVEQVAEQVRAARSATSAFGVNLFVPNPTPIAPAAYAAYRAALRPAADTFGVQLPVEPVEDDDQWSAKVDLLLTDPVAVASFTFGIPPVSVVRALQRQGTVVVQSVTSVAEAQAAVASGVDAVAVQAVVAGGHSATLTPTVTPQAVPLPELVAAVRAGVTRPVLAAGGVVDPAQVAELVREGAVAVLVGTALLRTPEAGTSDVHRAALARGVPLAVGRPDTVVTRAFTGRPARALRNAFVERFDGVAPTGYPAVHHLTAPLRRAAAAAGDPAAVHLWAGVGYRHCDERPAADVLAALSSGV